MNDPSQTPPPSPGVRQAPTPGHYSLDNENRTPTPGHYSLDNENRTPPPHFIGLRRVGREHNAEVWQNDMHTGYTPEGGMVDSPSQDSPSQQSPPRLVLSPSQYHEAMSNPQNAPISLLEEIERDLDDERRDLEAVIHNNQERLLRVRRRHNLIMGIIRNNGRRVRRLGVRARSQLTTEQRPFVSGRIFTEHRTLVNTPVPVRTPDVRRRGRGRQPRYSLDGTRRRYLEEKSVVKF